MKYILLFLLSLPAGAQTGTPTLTGDTTPANWNPPPSPAGTQTYDHMCGPNRDQQCVAGGTKLTCGKYEHVQKGRPGYSGGACDGEVGLTNCVSIAVWHEAIPDMCVEDMHEVTEAQWQAMRQSFDLLTNLEDIQEKQIMDLVKAAESQDREMKYLIKAMEIIQPKKSATP